VTGPIANTQLYVLETVHCPEGDTVSPLPIGIPGEVHIGGDGLARGYLNRPELTQERFINDPFSTKPAARLYKTGDLARFRADGRLEFLGRIDHQVKIRGFRIELGEIEAALSRHPAVKQGVVIDREDPRGEKCLVAYVVPNGADQPTAGELRQFLQKRLPHYMLPSAFVPLEALPQTPNGKIDRRALPDPAAAGLSLSVTYTAPRTLIERHLAEIWAEILKLEQIGIHDNFFELGGHSLLVAQLFAQVERRLNCSLPLTTVFQAPTVEQMANQIEASTQATTQRSPAPALVRLKDGATQPPLFLMIAFNEDTEIYLNLIRHFKDDRPVYGLRPYDANNRPIPFTRISDIAAYLIKQMQQMQPEGPYLLAGQCAGGVIAFEMAQQLQRRGESVALVALIEAVDVETRKVGVEGSRLWNGLRSLIKHLKSGLIGQPLYYYLDYYLDRKWPFPKFLMKRVLWIWLLQYHLDRQLPLPGFVPYISPYDILRFSRRQHLPEGRFAGNVVLIRATAGNGDAADEPFVNLYRDPLLGWGKRVEGKLQVYDVPGGHSSMLSDPEVRASGELLQAVVQAAAENVGAPEYPAAAPSLRPIAEGWEPGVSSKLFDDRSPRQAPRETYRDTLDRLGTR
jgi:thioesterase domain-containing protein/acyl carrier protein